MRLSREISLVVTHRYLSKRARFFLIRRMTEEGARGGRGKEKLRAKFQSRFGARLCFSSHCRGLDKRVLFVRVDVRKYGAANVCTAKNGAPMCN